MNEKFFNLSKEKQNKIINAGFKVFSQNSYKKSPVSEIAFNAGISKSLLFFYFKNKKELYLFLWEESGKITRESIERHHCFENTDFFEIMESGMKAKIELMVNYPDMSMFTIKAFYETDPQIKCDIQKSYQQAVTTSAKDIRESFDPSEFIEGINFEMMYKEIYLASSGYLWQTMQTGVIDPSEVEKDYEELIAFWKKVYLRKE